MKFFSRLSLFLRPQEQVTLNDLESTTPDLGREEEIKFEALARRVDALKKSVQSKYGSATQTEISAFRAALTQLNTEFTSLNSSNLDDEWEIIPSGKKTDNLISTIAADLRKIADNLSIDLTFLISFILKHMDTEGLFKSGEFFSSDQEMTLSQLLKDPARYNDLQDLLVDLKKMQRFSRGQENEFLGFLQTFIIKLHRVINGQERANAFAKMLRENQMEFKADCLADMNIHGLHSFFRKFTSEFTRLFIRASLYTTKYMSIDLSHSCWIPGEQEQKTLGQLNKVWENIPL